MQFPTVRGSNLARRQFTLPADLEGSLNVLLVAFYRWHQRVVDTWVPFGDELEREYPDLLVYELPVIQRMGPLRQRFIDGGMRAGIPDPVARARTITLYLDKPAFRRALDMPDEEDIYVLLVDRQGQVRWRERGAFTPQKGASLKAELARSAA